MSQTFNRLVLVVLVLAMLAWLGNMIWAIPIDVADKALTVAKGPEGFDYGSAILRSRIYSLGIGIPLSALLLLSIRKLTRRAKN